MSTKCADPFALDVSGFAPKPRGSLPAVAIKTMSEAADFPSRAGTPAPRRRRTGRNVQLDIKATQSTTDRFTALSTRAASPDISPIIVASMGPNQRKCLCDQILVLTRKVPTDADGL